MKKLVLAAALAALVTTPAFAKPPRPPAPPPMPVFSWAGCYVGVNGGYGWNNGNTHYQDDPNTAGDPINFITGSANGGNVFVAAPSATKGSGGLGGGGAGCNWQSQQWVYGVEGDIDGGRISGSQTNTVTFSNPGIIGPQVGIGPRASFAAAPTNLIASEPSQLNWLSTIRGRVGFKVQDRLLIFATGGLALGDVSSQGSVLVSGGGASIVWSGSHSAVKAGPVVGGGGEWAFADRWTAKAEYLWYDLGKVSHSLNCTAVSAALGSCATGFFATLGNAVSSIHGSIVRFGINYRFN